MIARRAALGVDGYLPGQSEAVWEMHPRPALAPLLAELLVRAVGLGLVSAALILGAILLA